MNIEARQLVREQKSRTRIIDVDIHHNWASEADLEAWRAHTTGPFRRQILDGDHFFIHSNPAPFFALLNDELSRSR